MNINIFSKNYELGDEVDSYIREAIQKLEKYSLLENDDQIIDVRLERNLKHEQDDDNFKVSINIDIKNHILFSEKCGENPFMAFDDAKNAIDKSIRELKEKLIDKNKNTDLN